MRPTPTMQAVVADADRFWSRVMKTDGCWMWRSRRAGRGSYGRHELPDGSVVLAHRAAWMLTNGTIPEKMYVCHHCDNPPCVRPDHLFLGSSYDNNADMRRKGRARQPRGESAPHAKLTRAQADEIRRRYVFRARRGPGSPRALASEFGIGVNHVRRIAIGESRRSEMGS